MFALTVEPIVMKEVKFFFVLNIDTLLVFFLYVYDLSFLKLVAFPRTVLL